MEHMAAYLVGGLSIMTTVGLFVLGLLWKSSIGQHTRVLENHEKRFEDMERRGDERQAKVLASFERLVVAQERRMQAIEERHQQLMTSWQECRHQHDLTRVKPEDLADLREKIETLFGLSSKIAQDMAAVKERMGIRTKGEPT